ncbi:MAG: hypothetical protein JWN95_2902 [Frankiales bacterium]|nr:hypothetical protein [Frankiales bacterium]
MTKTLSQRRLARGMLATLAVLLAGTAMLIVPTTSAGGATPAPALVRAAHFSPDTPGVDVYLTAFSGGTTRVWVPNAEYGQVSPYKRVQPGLYVVAMRPHGAAVSTPPVVSWNLDAKSGQAYTAAAIGANKALKTIVLNDNLSLPGTGTGRVRVIQAASRAPKADVDATNGPTVANDLAFASTSAYATVPAGTWTLRAEATTDSSISATAQVPVQSDSVTSLLVLDAPQGGITIRSVLDAAGAGTVPAGSVPAGGGGMAPNAPAGGHSGWSDLSGATGLGAGIVGIAIVVLVGVIGRSRRLGGIHRRARGPRVTG